MDEEFRETTINGLESHYQKFLESENETDTLYNRLGFYIAAKQAVAEEPSDDPEFNMTVMDIIDELMLPLLSQLPGFPN